MFPAGKFSLLKERPLRIRLLADLRRHENNT